MKDKDPDNIDQHSPGAKLDVGKKTTAFAFSQFFTPLSEVNKVSLYGAEKYTPNGWKDVKNGEERYGEAMLRHYAQHVAGELRDAESNLYHVSHMAWNALAVLHFVCERQQALTHDQENTLRLIQKLQEQIGDADTDRTSSPPAPKTEKQEDGDLKSIPYQGKCTSRITIGRKSKNTSMNSSPSSTTLNLISEP